MTLAASSGTGGRAVIEIGIDSSNRPSVACLMSAVTRVTQFIRWNVEILTKSAKLSMADARLHQAVGNSEAKASISKSNIDYRPISLGSSISMSGDSRSVNQVIHPKYLYDGDAITKFKEMVNTNENAVSPLSRYCLLILEPRLTTSWILKFVKTSPSARYRRRYEVRAAWASARS
jgi:hypothetical protein